MWVCTICYMGHSYMKKIICCLPDAAAATAAKSFQLCLTLWDPRDGSPPGSPVPGILQTRTLEWVAISFSKAWKWKGKVKSLSHVWVLATLWTAAYQAPLPMEFSRQEYWSGVPLPSPRVSEISFLMWLYLNVFKKPKIESPWTSDTITEHIPREKS